MTNEVQNDSVPVTPSTDTPSLNPVTPNVTPDPSMGTLPNEPQVQNMGTPKSSPADFIKKIGIAPIIAVSVLIIALIGGITFKVATSTPKAVFKSSINSLYKGLSNGIDEIEEFTEKFDMKNKALVLNGDIKFDASEEIFEDLDINLNNYSLGGELGIDINNEILQASAFIKGSSEKIDFQTYFEDGVAYVGSTLLDGIVKVDDADADIDFSEFQELFDMIEENIDLDSEDYDYVIKAVKEAIVKSLDSKYMSKESDEIKIAGEKVKVTKFSYTINEDAAQDMTRSIADTLLNDKDFIKKLSKLTEAEKDEIEEFLKEMKKEAKEISLEEKVVINVYQKGLLNTPAGFSIKVAKKELFHYYTDGENFDVKYDDNSSSEYSKTVVEITSKKKNKASEVTVKVNDEKAAELTVRDFSEKVIDFDYTIIDADEEVKGTVYLTYNESKNSIKGEYKFKVEYDGQHVGVEGSYGIESKDSLDKVDSSKVIDIDDLDEEKVLENLKEIAQKDDKFKTLYEMANEEYEKESLNINYNGMAELSSLDDVKKLFNKDKGIVLFVGSSYYSSYSDEDAYNLFENLKDLQDDLDFYSYYYNNYKVTDDFKELFKDVAPICKTSESTDNNTNVPPVAYEGENTNSPENENPENTPTEGENGVVSDVPKCNEYPVVYFIKDGKVVKAIQGTATKEELKESLKEIGIE